MEVESSTVSSTARAVRPVSAQSPVTLWMTEKSNRFIFVNVEDEMKNRYRRFKRSWGTYYAFDTLTGNSQSLKTRDRKVADRLIEAKNEAEREVGLRKKIGLIYLTAADPQAAKRTWQAVMDRAIQLVPAKSRSRWATAVKDEAFNLIRRLPIIETRTDEFLPVLDKGTVSTNVYLRRLQNLAIDLGWLAEPVLRRKLFPKPVYKKKRSILPDEHQQIIERERNSERQSYYEVIWHTGGAQSDIALLDATSINWQARVFTYTRLKTGQTAQIQIGVKFAAVLRKLPKSGPLFPYLRTVREADRATEFKQRCEGLGIHGVTLHSYRYSWAQRAKAAGYPQRYAQQALGHASKAVTEAYAADAQFVMPSLEVYEARASEQGGAPLRTALPESAPTNSGGLEQCTDAKALNGLKNNLSLN